MMTGVLVGLIVGVGVAIGVAFYMNKASVPYSNLERLQATRAAASEPVAEVLAPGAKLNTAEPAPVVTAPKAAASQSTAVTPKDDEQRFDFYKILPGQLEAVPVDPVQGTDTKTERPTAVPVRIYLQAGAFNNESDADNMKAKLALMGVEANILSSNVPEKGLVHRVRIGPFERAADVDALRQRLRQDGIEVVVVKLSAKQ
ncbi:hypothetical protein GCM10011419_19500 [Vogesella fluminis]|uniref:SPOR domain-containing protein n=2 Tax=Vogesella fluminis TaxID=1069161 RepID=A0ABQ3HCX7_9NEIS|nr:hypothetical protein GCM10011419_19500 [Vogesella fluminis]